MEDIYKRINKELDKTRVDLTFSPKKLDLLNEQQRKTVELKILKLCFYGNSTTIKYLPYIKYYDVIKTLESVVSMYPVYEQANIYIIFMQMTNDYSYIKKVLELAKRDINVFLQLVYLYKDNTFAEYNNLLYNDIMEVCKWSTDRKSYQDIIEKRGIKK